MFHITYAQPPELFRDCVEADINRHNRQPSPEIGKRLAATQATYNRIAKAEGIAPLRRRIQGVDL